MLMLSLGVWCLFLSVSPSLLCSINKCHISWHPVRITDQLLRVFDLQPPNLTLSAVSVF